MVNLVMRVGVNNVEYPQEDPDDLIQDEEEIMNEYANHHQEEDEDDYLPNYDVVPRRSSGRAHLPSADPNNNNNSNNNSVINSDREAADNRINHDVVDGGWDDDFSTAVSSATDQIAARASATDRIEQQHHNNNGNYAAHEQRQQQQRERPQSLHDSGCETCGILSVDNELWDVFGVRTCFACKVTDAGLKLITKSKAKEEYLLNDSQLSSLGRVRKENPKKPGWNAMILFLKRQVVARARQVWLAHESAAAHASSSVRLLEPVCFFARTS
jgi:hypothetical protein